jgi:hypothetical protein
LTSDRSHVVGGPSLTIHAGSDVDELMTPVKRLPRPHQRTSSTRKRLWAHKGSDKRLGSVIPESRVLYDTSDLDVPIHKEAAIPLDPRLAMMRYAREDQPVEDVQMDDRLEDIEEQNVEEEEADEDEQSSDSDQDTSNKDKIYVRVYKYDTSAKNITAADVIAHVADELLLKAIKLTTGQQHSILRAYREELQLRFLTFVSVVNARCIGRANRYQTDTVDMNIDLQRTLRLKQYKKTDLRAKLIALRAQQIAVNEEIEIVRQKYEDHKAEEEVL